ncbi:MAG: hypothetical protein JWQ21_528 [Herminiimonas sp.]|nr:hypothetical protein [Herminiimonas sp.]
MMRVVYSQTSDQCLAITDKIVGRRQSSNRATV